MNEQPDLITTAPTPPPALELARRKLEAIESAPPCYLKFDVEKTVKSEVYIRVLPGTKPGQVPRDVVEKAAEELDSTEWGDWCVEYSGYNGRECDADTAERYSPYDATGLAAARAEVARLEKEAVGK